MNSFRTRPQVRPSIGGRLCGGLLGVALWACAAAASAQVALFDPQEGINIVSLGVGRAPDHLGSNDSKTAIAPMGRYYLGGQRYVQLLGPQLSLNVLNDETWQFGPQLLYRLKRSGDVKDSVVSEMKTIPGSAEFGIFAGGSWALGTDPRNRIGVRTDVQAGKRGAEGSLTANLFIPVARAVVLNVGGGVGYTNSKWARTYFGVDGADVALFPSLGGAAYSPKGGVSDGRVNLGAIVHLSPNWHLGAGARYQRLRGDYADSPIVTERGSSDQWIYGLALGYVWQ